MAVHCGRARQPALPCVTVQYIVAPYTTKRGRNAGTHHDAQPAQRTLGSTRAPDPWADAHRSPLPEVDTPFGGRPTVSLETHVDLADFHMVRADRSHDATLVPLLKQYCRDMQAWIPPESSQAEGFEYPLEKVWGDGNDVYLAYAAGMPLGFAFVGCAQRHVGEAGTKDVVEFYVAAHARRNGIGRTLAAHLWNRYPGKWLVRVCQGNAPAMRFWASAIASYTGGQYREDVRGISGKSWSYFTFAASGPSGALRVNNDAVPP